MKSKQLLLIVVLLLVGCLANAQSHYTCDYDEAGNRIKRYYTIGQPIPAPSPEDTTAVQTAKFPDFKDNDAGTQNIDKVGKEQEEDDFRMLIYPNPVSDYFTLELPDLQPGATGSLVIISKMGLPIYSQNQLTQFQTINIGASPPDIYLIRIETGDKLYVVSVVKL